MKPRHFSTNDQNFIVQKISEKLTYVTDSRPLLSLLTKLEGKSEYEEEVCALAKHLNSFSTDPVSQEFNVFLNLQVETFFSLKGDRRILLLLEQLEICVKNSLFQKAKYIAQKIDFKSLDEIAKERFIWNKLSVCLHYEDFVNAYKVLENNEPYRQLSELLATLCVYLSKGTPLSSNNKIVEFKSRSFISGDIVANIISKYENILRNNGCLVSIRKSVEKTACIHVFIYILIVECRHNGTVLFED